MEEATLDALFPVTRSRPALSRDGPAHPAQSPTQHTRSSSPPRSASSQRATRPATAATGLARALPALPGASSTGLWRSLSPGSPLVPSTDAEIACLNATATSPSPSKLGEGGQQHKFVVCARVVEAKPGPRGKAEQRQFAVEGSAWSAAALPASALPWDELLSASPSSQSPPPRALLVWRVSRASSSFARLTQELKDARPDLIAMPQLPELTGWDSADAARLDQHVLLLQQLCGAVYLSTSEAWCRFLLDSLDVVLQPLLAERAGLLDRLQTAQQLLTPRRRHDPYQRTAARSVGGRTDQPGGVAASSSGSSSAKPRRRKGACAVLQRVFVTLCLPVTTDQHEFTQVQQFIKFTFWVVLCVGSMFLKILMDDIGDPAWGEAIFPFFLLSLFFSAESIQTETIQRGAGAGRLPEHEAERMLAHEDELVLDGWAGADHSGKRYAPTMFSWRHIFLSLGCLGIFLSSLYPLVRSSLADFDLGRVLLSCVNLAIALQVAILFYVRFRVLLTKCNFVSMRYRQLGHPDFEVWYHQQCSKLNIQLNMRPYTPSPVPSPQGQPPPARWCQEQLVALSASRDMRNNQENTPPLLELPARFPPSSSSSAAESPSSTRPTAALQTSFKQWAAAGHEALWSSASLMSKATSKLAQQARPAQQQSVPLLSLGAASSNSSKSYGLNAQGGAAQRHVDSVHSSLDSLHTGSSLPLNKLDSALGPAESRPPVSATQILQPEPPAQLPAAYPSGPPSARWQNGQRAESGQTPGRGLGPPLWLAKFLIVEFHMNQFFRSQAFMICFILFQSVVIFTVYWLVFFSAELGRFREDVIQYLILYASISLIFGIFLYSAVKITHHMRDCIELRFTEWATRYMYTNSWNSHQDPESARRRWDEDYKYLIYLRQKRYGVYVYRHRLTVRDLWGLPLQFVLSITPIIIRNLVEKGF
eukprot:g6741.t1